VTHHSGEIPKEFGTIVEIIILGRFENEVEFGMKKR